MLMLHDSLKENFFLAENQDNNLKLLWMLGLAITLPMILVGGPLAGYLIGEFVLVRQSKLPASTTPILMVLGLVGSGFQAFKLIERLKQNQKSKN